MFPSIDCRQRTPKVRRLKQKSNRKRLRKRPWNHPRRPLCKKTRKSRRYWQHEAAPAAPSPGLAQPRRLESAKYKIGILLPLSGRRELLGRELLDAAQIAVFDLADKDFVIGPFDTKGTEVSAAAAQEAVRTGVDLGLGRSWLGFRPGRAPR